MASRMRVATPRASCHCSVRYFLPSIGPTAAVTTADCAGDGSGGSRTKSPDQPSHRRACVVSEDEGASRSSDRVCGVAERLAWEAPPRKYRNERSIRYADILPHRGTRVVTLRVLRGLRRIEEERTSSDSP